jgi:hypothetical protein
MNHKYAQTALKKAGVSEENLFTIDKPERM